MTAEDSLFGHMAEPVPVSQTSSPTTKPSAERALPSKPRSRRTSGKAPAEADRAAALASEQLMTVDQAAAILAVSRRTLYRMIAAGEFPAPLRVGGARRVAASDLVEFLGRLKQGRS